MNHRRRIVLVVLGLLAAALVPLAAPPPAMAAGTVNVVVQGQGSVTDGGEINCTQSGGPDCSADYADTTYQECDPELKPPCWDVTETAVATLTAGAGTNGFVFDHWTNCESPSGSTCTHTVSSNVSITAVYRDTQSPSVAPPTPNGGIRRGIVTLATTASDNAGVTRVEFYNNGFQKLGEDGSAPYEFTWNTTGVADGAKSITAKAYDAALNQTTSASSGFTVDNTAPTVSVTGGPDGQTFGAGSTQTWSFTAGDATSGVAARHCSVVASGSPESFGACSGSNSHSVSGRPGGTYEFVVRVTDGGGLTATSAPRTFTIDDVAPDTSITSGPADGARMRTRDVSFGLGSTEPGSTFQCRVSPSGVTPPAFGACTSDTSHTASGLADGIYEFSVRATDQFGNLDATAVTRTFTVDDTAPTVAVTGGPEDQTFGPGTTQTWQFTSSDATSGVASRECSVVASGSPASFATCPDPSTHSVSGRPGGTYEFVVRVTDYVGLTATSAPRTFTIDDIAPATSITSGPGHGARVRTRTVSFGLGSTEPGSTFECRVSPSAFGACSAGATHTASGLADGTYVFSVRAIDQYGNLDATPVTRTFTVDTLAPQTTIRSGPASIVRTAGSTARVTFWMTSERYATFRCKLDARAWRSCASRPAYVVGLGAHTLRVAAVDRAGNVDRTAAVRRWTVRRR